MSSLAAGGGSLAPTVAGGASAALPTVSSGGGGKGGEGISLPPPPQSPPMVAGQPVGAAGLGAAPPPQVAPGVIQMAPGLAGPTMGAADAVAAGLGQSGAPGSTYGQGAGSSFLRSLFSQGGMGGSPPLQVAPGIIQMAPGLEGPTMGAADAAAAGLGQSGALGSRFGQGLSAGEAKPSLFRQFLAGQLGLEPDQLGGGFGGMIGAMLRARQPQLGLGRRY